MFEVNYSISDTYRQQDVDYKSADDMSLRYSLFLGSLLLRTDDSKIDLDWEWIPLLDFASCFLSIYVNLLGKTDYRQQFEFTESDGTLLIDRKGEKVKISTSFSNEEINISLDEFWQGLNRFYLDLLASVKEDYPGIEQNSNFIRYRKAIGNVSA